jgi:hypothetical protein
MEIKVSKNDEGTEPNFLCVECRKDCSGIPYAFAGGFACESCVRAYYREWDDPAIAVELRCRASEALYLIAKLQKRACKSRALSTRHLCDICEVCHNSENCPLDQP